MDISPTARAQSRRADARASERTRRVSAELEVGSLVAESEGGSGADTAYAGSSPAAQEASARSAGGSSLVAVRREAFDIVSRFRVTSANASHETSMGSRDISAATRQREMSLDGRRLIVAEKRSWRGARTFWPEMPCCVASRSLMRGMPPRIV